MNNKKEQKNLKERKGTNNFNETKKKKVKAILALTLIVVLIIIGIVLIVKVSDKSSNHQETIIEDNQEKIGTDEKNVSISEDGTKVNISDKIKEEKIVDGLKITDMEITEIDNVSTIVANVKNETKEDKGEYPIDIKLLDNEGKEIKTVSGYIGKIKAGESIPLTISATYDFSNAYNCEIVKK